MKRLLVTLLLLSCGLGFSQWQQKYSAELLTQGKDTLRYRILYPKNFDKGQKYPLILFLHGAGERGGDNAGQLVHGAGSLPRIICKSGIRPWLSFPNALRMTIGPRWPWTGAARPWA